MDVPRISFLIGCLLLNSFEHYEGRREIPDDEIQEGQILTGHFTVPHKVIEDEIYRCTNQDKACDADIRETLIKEDADWKISIVAGDVKRVRGDPNNNPYRYVEMKIYGDEVSLNLAYFTTRMIQHKNVFFVDSISWSDGVVTVKRGQDYLVLNTELGEDCLADLHPIKRKNLTMSLLTSLYSNDVHLHNCGIHGWPKSVCDHVTSDLCGLQKADGDICFKSIHEGYTCGMSMKIMFMTRIFREKSLMTAGTPVKSISGYHFSGLRRMSFVYPCLYEDSM